MRIMTIVVAFLFIISGDDIGFGQRNAGDKQEIAIYCKDRAGIIGNKGLKPAFSDSLIDYMIYTITTKDTTNLYPDNHILQSIYVNEVDK
jgi:hypothetical protein